ncbi:hypothetical protein HanPI659440_Chr11g0440271 [Helianthus annuus]|nr:hypothetical protein HanPI659440_Chr11g0440271 [Helianthus annuus]
MDSPQDAMPWVGLYIALASLICTFAMAADAIQGFWQRKFWFPNRFFTLNATTITLIAIAMKLPVDLTTGTYEGTQIYTKQRSNEYTKVSSLIFLVTMLANLLPSLGSINDKDLLTNIVALGILVITIIVNTVIQTFTQVHLLSLNAIITSMFTLLCPFSIALTVLASRKKIEHRYKESQLLVSCHQEKKFSYKGLKRYVKTYWMMAETHNPQFVIACSPVSSAFGFVCPILVFTTIEMVVNMKQRWYGTSDYQWSLKIIFMVQTVGAVVGCIAPFFRCFTFVGHFNLSNKWSRNSLNVFRVEKYRIQSLQQWKRSHVHSCIPGRHCKSYLERFRMIENESSDIEEYARYVVQNEEDMNLSKRILGNTLYSITQCMDKFEKNGPKSLMKLLEKSTGFNGVIEFDNDQVPLLYQEETRNCWSLVVVTLTTIAMALPNIANSHFKELLSSMREGFQIIRHIEESINVDGDSIKAIKAVRRVWTEIEVYRTWLQIDLQKKARKGKTSKGILKGLGDEAAKIVIQLKSNKKPSIDHSPYKFILASSMYRISQTILLHCNEQEYWPNDDDLFEWISTIIADVLLACFTNLPCVINTMCHHHAIEKRGDNIQNAAQLLGKSKNILKILKARQLPNIDHDSIAYIDKWHVLLKSQIPDGGHITASASSARIQSSSSCNESVIVTTL